ncbi:MAG: hypothetical protein ACKV2T_08595 [Kofleriaceae bacterium]
MGLTDLFKRGHSASDVALGPRQFSLSIMGHGVSARPLLPASIAHLADGTLVLGPFDLPAARASGTVRTLCIQAGTPPTGAFVKHSMSDTSIVTYTTEERGTTKLVLGMGVQSYDDMLASFGTIPNAAPWRIVTDNHELAWPAGFTLRASGDLADEHGAYELRLDGSPTNVIQFYGPFHDDQVPPPETLNSAGQTRIDAGSLPGVVKPVKHYTFEGDSTAQRYYYVHLDSSVIYLVRARAAIDAAPAVFAAADAVAQSLRPAVLDYSNAG